MKNMKNNKGFTLVELLGVIVIIGIIAVISITAVSRLIRKSKNEQKTSQENTVIMAAENYLQANRNFLPKAIGESTIVYLSSLKNSNYLKEDVVDGDGRSCMTNSYVIAYKESTTKYKYTARLYCGNDTVPEDDQRALPTIDIKFYSLDEDGNEVDATSAADFLSKVAQPKYKITITGGEKNGKEYDVEGYNYSISVTLGEDSSGNLINREVYSSGTLSASKSKKIVVPGDSSAGNVSGNLKDYIDITKATNVTIYVVARNSEGVTYSEISSIDGPASSNSNTTYNDTEKPVCSKISGQAEEGSWINKSNYSSNNSRKITVTCSDKGGSGCVRAKYTTTWPNKKEAEAEYSYIEVADNAGNKSGKVDSCKVRVNFDIVPPEVSVSAFKRTSDNKTSGSNILNDAPIKSTTSSDDKITIASNSYQNLSGGWMNKNNYPDGVIYQVTINDNLALKSYEWKVNNPNINSTSNSNYSTYSTNEENDGLPKVDISSTSGTCNTKNCTFTIAFSKEGMRKGVLTVVDKAGNKVTYTISANLDRTAPGTPTVTFKKVSDNSTYTPGNWTNSDVKSHVKGSAADSMSGWSKYEYVYVKSGSSTEVKGNVQSDDSDGYIVKDTGTNKLKYRSCDKANNCSSYTTDYSIMVDKIAPSVPTVTGYNKNTNRNNLTSTSGLSSSGVSSNNWVAGYLLLKASGSNDKVTTSDQSGFKEYRSTATGATTDKSTIKKDLRNVNDQGTSTVTYVACDNAGNCSSGRQFIAKIDLTPPSVPTLSGSKCNKSWGGCSSIGTNTWWNGYEKVTASGSIDTLSGGVYYVSEVNNSNPTANSTKGATRNITSEGTRTVYFKACDAVKNCTSVKSFVVKLDLTKPTKPSLNNAYGNRWVNFNYTISGTTTENGSGVANWQYKYASTAYTKYANSARTSFTTTAFSAQRNENVYIIACDNAGNCSDPATSMIRIDKTSPICTPVARYDNSGGSAYSGSLTCSNIYTTGSCNDPFGECDSNKTVTTSGATTHVNDSNYYGTTWTVERPGYSTLVWKVYDKAGNTGTCSTISVTKGTYSASSACGCATYEYACQQPKTKTTYSLTTVARCQPGNRQSHPSKCGTFYNTNTNMCCSTTKTTMEWGTCTSSICRQYNTCCHQ